MDGGWKFHYVVDLTRVRHSLKGNGVSLASQDFRDVLQLLERGKDTPSQHDPHSYQVTYTM